MELHNFIVKLGSGIIIICFFVSFAFAKKEKPTYYRYIFGFILSGVLLSLNTITSDNFAWRYGMKIKILIEQVLIIFQFIMLSLFFIQIIKNSKFLKRIKVTFLLSLFVQFIVILIVQVANIEIRPTTIPNLILIIFCSHYLVDFMNNKPTLVLIDSPTFWLVMGILFSACIGFPVSSLIPFISKTSNYSNLRYQIFSIYNMSLIIMYLFIIKSYTCLKHPQNS